MATRYIGDATIRISYLDDGTYAGTVSVKRRSGEKLVWKFDELRPPQIGHGRGIAYDSPKAYDRMAGSAVSFGAYYTTFNRGDDTPSWAPTAEIADAIDEATSWAMDDQGNHDVRRRP